MRSSILLTTCCILLIKAQSFAQYFEPDFHPHHPLPQQQHFHIMYDSPRDHPRPPPPPHHPQPDGRPRPPPPFRPTPPPQPFLHSLPPAINNAKCVVRPQPNLFIVSPSVLNVRTRSIEECISKCFAYSAALSNAKARCVQVNWHRQTGTCSLMKEEEWSRTGFKTFQLNQDYISATLTGCRYNTAATTMANKPKPTRAPRPSRAPQTSSKPTSGTVGPLPVTTAEPQADTTSMEESTIAFTANPTIGTTSDEDLTTMTPTEAAPSTEEAPETTDATTTAEPEAITEPATSTQAPDTGVGCGRQAAEYPPAAVPQRVIGGNAAKDHSWPWQVSVRRRNGTAHFCGGTLLRVRDDKEESDIVLTAAHCLPFDNGELSDYSHLQIAAGTNTRSDQAAPGEQRRKVIGVDYHNAYANLTNDVAILKLESPIPFSSTIRPICLAKEQAEPPVNRLCIATGWGRNETDSDSKQDELQQALAPVHSVEECMQKWKRKFEHWEYAFLCAGPQDGSSAVCNGDSGGPLMCLEEDGSWTQYGIASFVAGTTCAVVNFPPVFTRVSSYVGWIRERTNSLSSLTSS